MDDFFTYAEQDFDYNSISDKISLDRLLQTIIDVFKSQLSNSFSLLCSVVSIIILLSILKQFNFSGKKEIKTVTSSALGVSIFAISFSTLRSNAELVSSAIEKCEVFSLSAVPVITSFCVSSGEAFGATVFSSGVAICSAIFNVVSEKLIFPLIITYVLFGFSSIFTADFDSLSLCGLMKKTFKWIIGIFLGIYMFAISMQNILSKAADNLTKKTVQAAVGKFIPIVGSSLSAAVESVFSLASASKTASGIFGAIIILSMFLPSIIGNGCYGCTMVVCKHISAFFKLEKIDKISGILADVFFMLSALCGVCAFMLIVSFLLICINFS